MSKQKRHRKELARKKRDTNARRRRDHSFASLLPRFSRTNPWRMSSNLFFRSSTKVNEHSVLLFVGEIWFWSLSLSLSLPRFFRSYFLPFFSTYIRTPICTRINFIPLSHAGRASLSIPLRLISHNSGNNYRASDWP